MGISMVGAFKGKDNRTSGSRYSGTRNRFQTKVPGGNRLVRRDVSPLDSCPTRAKPALSVVLPETLGRFRFVVRSPLLLLVFRFLLGMAA
jgi:hypothetical protein